jgi:hypothetical protein
MSRITTFRCDRCGELIADESRTILVLQGPGTKGKWATDLCDGCASHIKNQADFTLKAKAGRKVKQAAAPVGTRQREGATTP